MISKILTTIKWRNSRVQKQSHFRTIFIDAFPGELRSFSIINKKSNETHQQCTKCDAPYENRGWGHSWHGGMGEPACGTGTERNSGTASARTTILNDDITASSELFHVMSKKNRILIESENAFSLLFDLNQRPELKSKSPEAPKKITSSLDFRGRWSFLRLPPPSREQPPDGVVGHKHPFVGHDEGGFR